ncbi:hypothetical protein [Burkholderia cenocepacia]|uniref:Uncharacterized protein n=1 Tax=Burkholderia cenocepacia TaxID=95486 RepID=A0A3S9NF40_9BURK|nr:hypothetical protein [Burkholderia cenocepacia]AZQ54372.1 hypothetical protein D5R55_25980 [Burkholderia cenocepacia]
MILDRPRPYAAAHYVVKRREATEIDAWTHEKGAGRRPAFPELWNSAPRCLADGFRLRGRRRELEEMLEFGRGKSELSAVPSRSNAAVAQEILPGAVRNDMR